MNAKQVEYKAVMSTVDFLINDFSRKTDHKTAVRSLRSYRTRLALEGEVYGLRKTWVDYLRETTWGERIAALVIVASPLFFSWGYYAVTGHPVQF